MDPVPDSDFPLRENLGAQSSSVDKACEDPATREPFEVRARLTQPYSPHSHSPDEEFTTDEMVQWDAFRHDVPAGVPGRDLHVTLPLHRLDGLALDERDLSPRARSVGIRSRPQEVTVPFEPPPGDRAYALDGARRILPLRCDVDRNHTPGPSYSRHSASFIRTYLSKPAPGDAGYVSRRVARRG